MLPRPALRVYAALMVEENREELSETSGAAMVTPAQMTEALDAMRAASPSMAGKLDAAGVTPDELAGAHDAATQEEGSNEQS